MPEAILVRPGHLSRLFCLLISYPRISLAVCNPAPGRQVVGQGDTGEGGEALSRRRTQRRNGASPDAKQYLLQCLTHGPGIGCPLLRGRNEQVQPGAEVFARVHRQVPPQVLDAFLELAYRLDIRVDVGRHGCLCASGYRIHQAFGDECVFGSVFVLHSASLRLFSIFTT